MAPITQVPLSLCRMLEDDLKISSDEEEAEQQVSSLCSPLVDSWLRIFTLSFSNSLKYRTLIIHHTITVQASIPYSFFTQLYLLINVSSHPQ